MHIFCDIRKILDLYESRARGVERRVHERPGARSHRPRDGGARDDVRVVEEQRARIPREHAFDVNARKRALERDQSSRDIAQR